MVTIARPSVLNPPPACDEPRRDGDAYLVPDAEDYERALLDAYDANRGVWARSGHRERRPAVPGPW